MKTFLLFVIFNLYALLAYAQEPVFRLRDLENNWKEYVELKGERATVIDFWATWCQPCLNSLPLLDQIANDYRKSGVQIIGINVDGPRNQSKVKPFIRSRGIEYPVLRDTNGELMSLLNVTAIPTLIIFDSKGEMVFFHEGYRPGDEILIRKELDNILNE